MPDPPKPRLTLTVVPPTAEGIAPLMERVTGRKPDVQKIRAKLDAKLAAKQKARNKSSS
jgi:hypothetical protein